MESAGSSSGLLRTTHYFRIQCSDKIPDINILKEQRLTWFMVISVHCPWLCWFDAHVEAPWQCEYEGRGLFTVANWTEAERRECLCLAACTPFYSGLPACGMVLSTFRKSYTPTPAWNSLRQPRDSHCQSTGLFQVDISPCYLTSSPTGLSPSSHIDCSLGTWTLMSSIGLTKQALIWDLCVCCVWNTSVIFSSLCYTVSGHLKKWHFYILLSLPVPLTWFLSICFAWPYLYLLGLFISLLQSAFWDWRHHIVPHVSKLQ